MTRHFIAAAILAAATLCQAWAQQSTSFVMERACVGGGGQTLVSASFHNVAVFGTVMPLGIASSCAGGIQTSIGYCLVAGEIPQPLVLDVSHNAAIPGAVDVIWNGAAASYLLYRDFDPVSVVSPGNLFAETPACQVTDSTAPGHTVIYYSVVPRP